jgi:hypothetical protein
LISAPGLTSLRYSKIQSVKMGLTKVAPAPTSAPAGSSSPGASGSSAAGGAAASGCAPESAGADYRAGVAAAQATASRETAASAAAVRESVRIWLDSSDGCRPAVTCVVVVLAPGDDRVITGVERVT